MAIQLRPYAEAQNRTGDTAIFSRVLYRLSYLGDQVILAPLSLRCQATVDSPHNSRSSLALVIVQCYNMSIKAIQREARYLGLSDRVLGKENSAVSLNKPEALAAIGVAAVASDGEVSPEEVERIVIDLATLRAFRGFDLRDLGNTLNKVAGLIKRRGMAPIIQAAKAALTKDELQAAFFVAVDLVLADGIIKEDEKKFLGDLQVTLQIDEATALKITEAVVIKNRA
jgi:tellurite resistance protein